MTTETRISTHKLLEGQSYTVARGVTLASGATTSVAIENPSSSGVVAVINTQVLRADSAAHGVYYRSPDISGSSSESAGNDLIGSSKTTEVNVHYDGSYSNASKSTNFPMGEAGASDAPIADRPPVALKPGESVGIEVTSDAADNDILFLITMYETVRGVNN